MPAFQRLPRPAMVAITALALGVLLATLFLQASSAPAALAAERAVLLGVVAGPPVAAPAGGPLGAPAAQLALGSWVPMGSMANQGAEATSAPAAVSWGPGRLDLFVRGRNGELFQNYRQGNWSGWSVPAALRGIVLRSAPSCASWGVNRLSCVALTEGNTEVWHFYWDGTGWGRQSLGGNASSAPTIASNGPGQLAVFVAGDRNQLFGKSWVRNQWSDWRNLGGELRSAPTCTAWNGDALIQCFVTSTQNWIMRQEVRIGQGFVEGRGYVQVSMRVQADNDLTLGSAPSAVAVGPRRVALLALNAGQTLYTTTWAGNDQVVWQRTLDQFSPALNSVPSCAVSSGRLDCFARGPDSRMLNGFGDVLQAVANVP